MAEINPTFPELSAIKQQLADQQVVANSISDIAPDDSIKNLIALQSAITTVRTYINTPNANITPLQTVVVIKILARIALFVVRKIMLERI